MSDNELIAEFMGAEYRSGKDYFNPDRTIVQWIINGNPFNQHRDSDVKYWYTPEQLMYDKSWDWLMPVVEKIETMKVDGYTRIGYDVNINYKLCTIDAPDGMASIVAGQGESKIEAVYKAVVEFIKWYNTNTPEQTDKPGAQDEQPAGL